MATRKFGRLPHRVRSLHRTEIARHLDLNLRQRRGRSVEANQLATTAQGEAGSHCERYLQCCHVTPNPLVQPVRTPPCSPCSVGPPLTLMPQEFQTRRTTIPSMSAAGSVAQLVLSC